MRNTETFLTPIDTQISIEAWLNTADNIESPNRYGDYEFEFTPVNSFDYFRVEELVHSSLMRAERHRCIDMKDMTTRNGVLFCSQLFAPKLNRTFEYPGQINHSNDPVSLNLHLRDDKHGNIYLQCDYMDFYEEPERIVEALPDDYDPDDDF